MKRLLVLRHAKSDRSDSALQDHDRPLASRGKAGAPQMGHALAALDTIPDAILTSTAVRARETARLAATAMGYGGKIVEESALYAAPGNVLLNVLRDADDAATLLLVGHNPGLEELIGLLTGSMDAEPILRLPTAGLACLALEIEDWSHIYAQCGLLHWFLTPRIVHPLLHAPRDLRHGAERSLMDDQR